MSARFPLSLLYTDAVYTLADVLWHVPGLEAAVQRISSEATRLWWWLKGSASAFSQASSATDGGAWSAQMHDIEGSFDAGVAKALLEVFGERPSEVLDVGCGVGRYLKALHDAGIPKTHGLEPNDMKAVWPEGPVQLVGDLLRDVPDALEPVYEAVINFEVAEHVPREHHGAFFDALVARTGRVLVFSGATPFQLGLGHIACRPLPEWREEIVSRGLVEDVAAGETMRAAATVSWLHHNLMVFRRPDAG